MCNRELVYETALRAARPLLRLAAPLNPKLRLGLSGRDTAVRDLVEWASVAREPRRPLAWVHAPSVGEALMAQAIISELRGERPDLQLIFTYFSPSAERVAQRTGADYTAYLPWDLTAESREVLGALRPDLLAFVRTEIWPVLAREARLQGTQIALVNAVLAAGSSRLRGPARFLLGPGYQRLHRVGAVAEGDADRIALLGVPRDRIEVTGDARFDQVWNRIAPLQEALTRNERPLLQRLTDDGRDTIVAGSTWPADEELLVPALARALGRHRLRLVIAPHEPTPEHLTRLEDRLGRAGLQSARLSLVEDGSEPLPDVVIVDRVGVLADLYAIARIAYVGGGFGGDGLHSVVEPAALGVPTIFGPRLGNALEAGDLARAGGGFIINEMAGLDSAMELLISDAVRRAEASAAARIFVRSRLGGARRNAELLARLLDPAAELR